MLLKTILQCYSKSRDTVLCTFYRVGVPQNVFGSPKGFREHFYLPKGFRIKKKVEKHWYRYSKCNEVDNTFMLQIIILTDKINTNRSDIKNVMDLDNTNSVFFTLFLLTFLFLSVPSCLFYFLFILYLLFYFCSVPLCLFYFLFILYLLFYFYVCNFVFILLFIYPLLTFLLLFCTFVLI
jgi:hypothetical protein